MICPSSISPSIIDQQPMNTSIQIFGKRFWTLLVLNAVLFIPLMVSAQRNIRLEVYQVQTTIPDCDGFLSGDSDPTWWWTGPGVINDDCYQTTCNGCTRAVSYTLMNETYNCPQDVPATVQVRFRGCEDDGTGCVGGLFTGICDGNAADRTDNFAVVTTVGTTNIGPFAANSTGCAGTYQYWARWVVSGNFLAAPTNDNLCSATALTLGTTASGNNTCATVQGGEVDPADGSISPSNSVWYTFTAPPSGHVIVTTDFAGTSFDTEIAVYRASGSPCPGTNWGGLTEVGSDDDIVALFNLKSELELECLTPGATYYVQVDGNSAADFGAFQIRVSSVGAALPTNDLICNAINLGTLNSGGTIGNNNFNNFCATTSGGEPVPGAFGIDATVWFRFTTGATVGYEALLSASNDPLNLGDQIDLQLAVYSSSNNTCTGTLSEVESDYFSPPFAEDLTVNCLRPNTTYFVQVDGSSLNTVGYFGLTVSDNGVPQASNDLICNAINLGTVGLGQTVSNNNMNNFCAGISPGEPNFPGCASGIDQTIWATFTTGPAPGYEMTITGLNDPLNQGDQTDVQLGMYTSSNGTCTGALTIVDCEYDPGFFDEEFVVKCLQPNTTYFVQLDGSILNVQGYIGITVADDGLARAQNDLICNATPLGTIPTLGNVTLTNQNNYCGGVEPGEPDPLSHGLDQTVWYTFKPPVSGSVVIDLVNQGAIDNIDLQVAVWESSNDSCNGFFAEVESYDDPFSFSIDGPEALRLKCLDTSKTYFIQVDGAFLPLLDNHVGVFNLTVTDYNVTAAPHDSICNAIPLGNPTGGSVGLTNQHNFCANNILEPIPSCWGTNMTVWYTFVAPSTGRVTIDLVSDPLNVGDYIDLQVAVFALDGDTCGGLPTEVGCDYNDLLEFPPLSRDEEVLVTCLTPGRTYWIMVDGSDDPDDVDGFFDITVTEEAGPPPITNDDICQAVSLGAVPGGGSIVSAEFHNFCATVQPGEPVPGTSLIPYGLDQTVWFTFTAPPSGNLTISGVSDPNNRGDEIDMQIAVYASDNGTCTGNMVEVVSDYDPGFFDEDVTVTCLKAGSTYWIQVDGALIPPPPLPSVLVEGYFNLTLTEDPAYVPMPTNDLICGAVNLGTPATGLPTPLYTGSNYCAETEVGEPNIDACALNFDLLCDETVWFTFTTNNNPGTISVELTNLLDIIPAITVYSVQNYPSCNFNDLTFLADATALPFTNLSLDLPCLPANTTFYIQVDGVDIIGDEGRFDIQIFDDAVPQNVPTNDSICNATNLGLIASGGSSAVTPGSNICSREEPNEPNVSGGTDYTNPLYDETVWYQFTTSGTPGIVTVNVTGVSGGLQTSLTVYQSLAPPSCSFNDLLEYDYLTALVPDANLSFPLECLQPNTTYYIQLDGLDVIGDNGDFNIQVVDNGTPHLSAPNDDICNATGLGVVPVNGSTALTPSHNFCATTESNEPNVSGCSYLNDPFCDETVWFSFTTSAMPGNTTVAITNTVGIDASINIYSVDPAGSCNFNDLTLVEDADDLLSNDVSVTMACLPPNTTYFVQVDGVDVLGDVGTFNIRVSDASPSNTYPANDSICNAHVFGVIPAGGSSANVAGNNFCATTEPNEPSVDACPTISSLTCDETVWYQFTTSATPGTITVNVTNTVGINAVINVYRVLPSTSCNFSDLEQIASRDDLLSNNVSLTLPCLIPNTTYYIQLDGVDVLGDYGTFNIQVSDNGSFVAAPANDLICQAVFMGNPNNGQVGPTAGNNNCASEEANEPNVNGDDETVWYSFIAPASGSVEVTVTSVSGIDVVFNLYHSEGACGMDSITQVGGSHFDLLSFSASAVEECLIPGDLYYVQIDGVDILGDMGNFTITVADDNPFFSGPVNDPCSSAVVVPIGTEPCYGSGAWNVYNYGNPTVSLNNSFVSGCGDNCGDLWYTFTMPTSGTVLVEGNDEYGFLGLNNSEVTVAAYTGPCSNLTPQTCEQGGTFDDPTYFVSAAPGTQIYLQVFDDEGDDINEPFGLCVTDRCGSDNCNFATPMTEGLWYCWDTDGATGETIPADPGYLECGDGTDPGHSIYLSYTNRCPTFTVTVEGTIGGLCLLGEPTDGVSMAIYLDGTPCDGTPDAMLDCEQTDACLGTTWFFQRTYAVAPGTDMIIQLDGFDFTGDNSGQIRIDEGCPLDVPITRFIAYREDEVHELEWNVTNDNVLNGQFKVERSLDGIDFEQIGRVNGQDYDSQGGGQGQGQGAGTTYDYHFTDATPVPGHNYYRLRFVDQNGAENFSEVIDLYFDETVGMQIVGLYPNPAREIVNLDTYVPKAGKYTVRIVDMYGKVALTEVLDLELGLNSHAFQLDRLSSGLYMIYLGNAAMTESVHKKMVKQ